MFMLDTNICIFLEGKRSPELLAKFTQAQNIGISAITYGELCFGVENGAPHLREFRYSQWQLFMSKVELYPWDFDAAAHYGTIRSHLKKRGEIIGHNDLLIAAHAQSLGATLVTNNTREFSRIETLKLEDWTVA